MQQLIFPSIQAFNTNITGFAARHFLMHTRQNVSEISSPFRNVLASCLSSFSLGTLTHFAICFRPKQISSFIIPHLWHIVATASPCCNNHFDDFQPINVVDKRVSYVNLKPGLMSFACRNETSAGVRDCWSRLNAHKWTVSLCERRNWLLDYKKNIQVF